MPRSLRCGAFLVPPTPTVMYPDHKHANGHHQHVRNGRPPKVDHHLYEEVALEELPLAEAPLDSIALDEADGPVLHRDLGDIEVTASGADGLGAITINRTKGGISPFVPIVKTPTYAENSGNLTGYAVEIEDPAAETGYRHLGNVSAGYLLLPNDEVRALALEVAVRSGLPFKESRIFWDGARFAHVIDFIGEGATEEVAPGDGVGLSLVTRSSYDKSWRYESRADGEAVRLRQRGALGGVLRPRRVPPRERAGVRGLAAWKDVVREGLALVDRAPDDLHRFAAGLRALRSGGDDGPAAARGVAAVPDDRRRHQGAGRLALRRARGADALRALQRRDERAVAPRADDGGGLRATTRRSRRAPPLRGRAPQLNLDRATRPDQLEGVMHYGGALAEVAPPERA